MSELIDIPVGSKVKVLSGRAKDKIGEVVKETEMYVYVRIPSLRPPLVRVAKWNVQLITNRRKK